MNRFLLDTHAFLWFVAGNNQRLPKDLQALISNPDNEIFLSAASVWEISTKHRLGKLPGVEEIVKAPEAIASALRMTPLAISFAHAKRAGTFEAAHRDPFDRMLAAQSLDIDAALISVDHRIDVFGVRRVWDETV